jgi:hypothetical protein
MSLRKWRQRWQRIGPAALAAGTEVKSMFQALQALLMRVLLLDRENRQALSPTRPPARRAVTSFCWSAATLRRRSLSPPRMLLTYAH